MTDQPTTDGTHPHRTATDPSVADVLDELLGVTDDASAPSSEPTDDASATSSEPTDDTTAETDDAAAAADGELEVQPVPDPEERAAADGRTPGQLLVALEEAESTRSEYLDQLQRLQAEFDNFRRRSRVEAQTAHANGAGWLAGKLLEALDDLDRTVQALGAGEADTVDEGVAGGVRAVRRKLLDTFGQVGVARVDQADVPFDATIHEAVQQVPADPPVDHPVVEQVLRPGYVHGDRCLRPAMVVVRQ